MPLPRLSLAETARTPTKRRSQALSAASVRPCRPRSRCSRARASCPTRIPSTPAPTRSRRAPACLGC
eukprot:275841-Prymnesium_polylepis.1